MASQGPLTTASWSSQFPPLVPWINPPNAQLSDNIYTTCDLLPEDFPSDLLSGTSFGFAIPGTATINGVLVEIERKAAGAGDVNDVLVNLIVAGALAGLNHADPGNWPAVDTFLSYGGAADLWGVALTPALVNDGPNFGVGVGAVGVADPVTAMIDNIRMTVFFTEASGSVGWLLMGVGNPQ